MSARDACAVDPPVRRCSRAQKPEAHDERRLVRRADVHQGVGASLRRAVLQAWLAIVGAASAPGAGLSDDALRAALDALLEGAPACRRTTVTLKVVDLQTDRVLYDRGGDRLLTPASNLKLYTSACAVDVWPPEQTFPTRVRGDGPLAEGVLYGDFIVVGGGNAMLTSAELRAAVDAAVDRWGLRRICGRVRVDNSRYASPWKGPGWMWDDDPDAYNMSVSPLMVDFNVLKVRIEPYEQASAAVAKLVPPSLHPRLKLATGAAAPSVGRRPFRRVLEVQLPDSLAAPFEAALSMHDPGAWAAGLVAARLGERGVARTRGEVRPAVAASFAPPPTVEFAGTTLIDALRHFNRRSENAVGEVLLHELAIAEGIAQPAWSDGAATVSRWLVERAGLERDSFRLVDGSGLSRYNLISADSSVRLLAWMHKHPRGSLFYGALPRYAVEGVREAAAGEQAATELSVAAKPGGMAGVSTISGYVDAASGRRLAFSLLANGFVGSPAEIHALRSAVWRLLVQWEE